MGFYITGDDDFFEADDLRQHINLSAYAWNIIEDDISNFYLDNNKPSFAGFLNTIFYNFYHNANAAISQRYITRYDELQELFSSSEFKNFKQEDKDIYIDKMLDVYLVELIEKAMNHEKTPGGRKFRVNKVNTQILRNSTESIHYNDNIGNYLKAIYEEYALLPSYKREQIFFKENVDKINNAIGSKRKLKLSIMRKRHTNKEGFYFRTFYVTPHKIVQDKTNSYNYLIGYSEELLTDGKTTLKQPVSFRISRLDRINIMSSMKAFISKDDLHALEKEVEDKGVQFLAGELIDVIVKFNPKGFEAYERQLYLRPTIYKKIDSDTYHFKTTFIQAQNYFFKIGRDIEVLEPVSLRESFINRYKTALEVYIK